MPTSMCSDQPVYTDGVVTLRRQHPDDLELHLSAVDEALMTWLWESGDRERYLAMSPEARRQLQLQHLHSSHDSFGSGPKWCFSVDAVEARYVVYVDCDLANEHVPAGDANISYACRPEFRGKGYASRAVRLVCEFLREQTSASEAHILTDAENIASARVARAVGAVETSAFVNEQGRTVVRHVLDLRS